MSRRAPFDVVFQPLVAAFTAIRTDAERVGRDARERAQFAQVPEVQRLLQRLEPGAGEEAPGAAREYLEVLHAAWRFWHAGQHLIPVARDDLAARTHASPADPPAPVPHGACYLQLPPHWIWARVAPDAAFEPLDGIFLTEAPRGDERTCVAILGFRPERDGFSQLSVSAHPDDLPAAAAAARRDRFAPVMDGGAEAGMRSIISAGELLLLAHLALDSARH